MQHPPRTTSPLAHASSSSASSSSAIASSWQIYRQPENTVDVFGDDYDTSPFDETVLANGLITSPLSVASQSPLRLEASTDSEDEQDPFADCYHPQSRLPRPASTSAPASAYSSGFVGRPSSRAAPVVPRRGGAYGRYADPSSRARRHHQTTPSTMTSSAHGLRKPQTPMQMLYDLPYTPSSTPSASPNSRRRATLPSPPPVPARPRVVEPEAPLVVHSTRPSPFPLGPTPLRRTGRAETKPVPVHIVDVAVERFGLQLQTPSTAPSSAASSSDASDDTTEVVTPTTTIASSSPVTTTASSNGMMMRRKPAVTALDMERERQWALWEAEHAPSATIAATEQPVEKKKKLFSVSSSKSSSTTDAKEVKPKKQTKTRSSRWWCCFGSSAHETDDEEEWDVEHEKSPRPASRLRKRAN